MSTTHTVAPNTQTAAAKPMTLVEATAAILSLQAKVIELETAVKAAAPRNKSEREMTDEDARRVLIGDCKDLKHKEAAEKLGLSYGQVYSCRLDFTFKHIHKELKERDGGFKNPWVKG